MSTGKSAGLTFRYVGGVGKSFGNRPLAALIAVITSPAAPSMLRLSANCNVIVVVPTPESDVIWSRLGICVNCCSSGVATAEAIFCGLAPG